MSKASVVRSNKLDHKNEISDSQAPAAFGERLRLRAEEIGLEQAEIGRKAGIKKQSMSGYWNGERFCGSDKLFALSDALRCNARWLIAGEGPKVSGDLASNEEADWIQVPEYDLDQLTDEGKGPVVSTTPFRLDMLNRAFGHSATVWLTRLPADLPVLELREGDLAFVRDLHEGEAQDGAVYIVRIWGRLTVMRLDSLQDAHFGSAESSLSDRRLAFRNIGYEDGKAILVARVLGVPLKRL